MNLRFKIKMANTINYNTKPYIKETLTLLYKADIRQRCVYVNNLAEYNLSDLAEVLMDYDLPFIFIECRLADKLDSAELAKLFNEIYKRDKDGQKRKEIRKIIEAEGLEYSLCDNYLNGIMPTCCIC